MRQLCNVPGFLRMVRAWGLAMRDHLPCVPWPAVSSRKELHFVSYRKELHFEKSTTTFFHPRKLSPDLLPHI
jgi:hypothetical protein